MEKADAVHTTSQALTLADLNTTVNHEPRIAHRRLAVALGFAQIHKMGHLVERHLEALRRFGEVSSTVDGTLKNKGNSASEVSSSMDGTSAKGGRPGKTYWLNKRQCLYLCTKSETQNATEVTIQMVEVFDAHLRGELKPVRVRAHRRAKPSVVAPLPAGNPLPGPFQSGSDLLRDLFTAVMTANLRIERGEDPNFGRALQGVLSDIIDRQTGGPGSGKRMLEWNWRRLAVRTPA